MATITLAEAVRDTLAQEMRRDDGVVVIGHAVGKMGGVFHATEGLLEEFGEVAPPTPIDAGLVLYVCFVVLPSSFARGWSVLCCL